MPDFDFDERLQMSDVASERVGVAEILVREFPGATSATRASISDDRKGTDWWVKMPHGRQVSVDVKARGKDYLVRRKEDDYALEIYSVIDGEVPGWTRDEKKSTDYILWIWKESGRWALVPFRPLCAVFQEHWERWAAKYRRDIQTTSPKNGRPGWQSECVYVPRRVVWGAIYNRFSGKPCQPPKPNRSSRDPAALNESGRCMDCGQIHRTWERCSVDYGKGRLLDVES